MSMMTLHILRSVDFTQTQKSRYPEKETLFFLQINKLINYTSRATFLQKVACIFFFLREMQLKKKLSSMTYQSLSIIITFQKKIMKDNCDTFLKLVTLTLAQDFVPLEFPTSPK